MSETDQRWRAYLINLDRSPNRMEAMTQELERAQIPFERVAGVDGKAMQPED
jgi:GR25 family glycosyltransferase involved in LPS biosynthesis